MSLLTATKIETTAFVGSTPWGIGTKVPDDLTPDQMLKAAGLDWEVEKSPLYTRFDDNEIRVDKSALIRTSDGSVLDVVGDDWNPVQNYEAFEFFNDFIAAGEMKMDTAGSLKGGRNVWALAKINESFDILGGDVVESYLLFSNPHQYGKSIDIRTTNVRVTCANTLTSALNGKAERMFKMNHRRVFDGDAVKEILGISKNRLLQYKEAATFLSTKRFTDETIVEYFNRVFPVTTGAKKDAGELASRAARQAFENLETQPGAEFAPGSWWQALNSATYYVDHVKGRSDETRMQSAWFGSGANTKINALNIALEMATVA